MQEDITDSVKKVLGSVSDDVLVRVLVGEDDIVESKDRVEAEVVRFLQDHGIRTSLAAVKGALATIIAGFIIYA